MAGNWHRRLLLLALLICVACTQVTPPSPRTPAKRYPPSELDAPVGLLAPTGRELARKKLVV